ncbi:MAG: hypothetical protein V2B19_23255 [Pseudomonadota bacterium]
MNETPQRLAQLLRRNQIMDFDSIAKAAGGKRSRRSLYRDLTSLGHITSFTHAGSYYTLADIPQFDENGLWFFKGIGFSRSGTLKTTLVGLIEASEAGCTHNELKDLLHVRVHNTLFSLVQEKKISREPIEKLYVYVSFQLGQSADQVTKRRERLAAGEKIAQISDVTVITVIEVLMEVIRAGKVLIGPIETAQRLRARGIPITLSQVEDIYARYGLKALKKIPH